MMSNKFLKNRFFYRKLSNYFVSTFFLNNSLLVPSLVEINNFRFAQGFDFVESMQMS